MSGRVPPSSRSRDNSAATQAARRYTRFTGHEAENLGRILVPALPSQVAVVGELDGVLYTTVRDGITESYKHEFARHSRPLLTVSPNGRQLIIVGGNYLFTERGIVDKGRR